MGSPLDCSLEVPVGSRTTEKCPLAKGNGDRQVTELDCEVAGENQSV